MYFDIRGIVEGFYGKPWSHEERKDILAFMKKNNYNLYIYAPKADTYHRFNWEKKYPKNFMQEFKELVKIGEKNNIDVSIAISPGLSLKYSDEEQRKKLEEKFLDFINIGVKTISLFLDDIPPKLQYEEDIQKFTDLADAQQDFTNKLYNSLSKKINNFIFCPTHYHGKIEDYQKILGEKLNKNINIIWTGPQVCSKELPYEDSLNIKNAFKRKVLYWDNYPVNDSVMVSEMHLGPYINRDKKLYENSKGFLINPMNQPYASMITLGAISEYLNNPETYDADEALKLSINQLTKEPTALYEFSKVNIQSPLTLKNTYTLNIIKHFNELYSISAESGITYLKDVAEEIKNTYQKLLNLENKLKNDLNPWLKTYAQEGEIIKSIATVLELSQPLIHENFNDENKMDLTKEINILEKLLQKNIEFESKVFGENLISFALIHLKNAKGFIKLNYF